MILPVSAQRFCCRNRVARVVGHWGAKSAREKFKGSGGTANFGLLRDPSFLGPGMRTKCINPFLSVFFYFHQKDSKNHPIGDSAHARRQKGGVPEAAEIGRTHIPFQNESTEGKLKNKSKNIPTGNSAHARCQKGGVPEEAEIYLQLIHFKKV